MIFYQIDSNSQLTFLGKCMEVSLENYYVDMIGAERVLKKTSLTKGE